LSQDDIPGFKGIKSKKSGSLKIYRKEIFNQGKITAKVKATNYCRTI
jgi:hypothetical protein